MKKVILINPLVSSEYLSERFKQNNIYTIAVYTACCDELDEYSKPDKRLFDEQLFFPTSSVSDICAKLKIYQADYIINGAEEYTSLTDAISEGLFLKLSNNSSTSHKRSNKYQMQEILNENNLPYIKQIKIDINTLDITNFNDFKFPVFLKPVQGYGSINAFKITSPSNLSKKVVELKLEDKFNEYLIQEFVEGTEYIVDTFSINGVHYLCDILQYHKENYNGQPIYRYVEVVTDKNIWMKVRLFIIKVLTALDVNNGMAHSEIFIKDNGDIKLIELNNRVSGAKGYLNKLVKSCYLKSHDEFLIEYLKGVPLNEVSVNKIKNQARCLFLFNFKNQSSNTIRKSISSIDSIKEIKILNSFQNNDRLSQDFNLLNCACIMLLHNESNELLDMHTKYIFELEQSTGIFD